MADEKVEVAEAPSKEEVEMAKAEIAEEVRYIFLKLVHELYVCIASMPFIY